MRNQWIISWSAKISHEIPMAILITIVWAVELDTENFK